MPSSDFSSRFLCRTDIQLILSTVQPAAVFRLPLKKEFSQRISTVIHSFRSEPIILNCHEEHLHLFFSLHPDYSLSEIVHDIRERSLKWIYSDGSRRVIRWSDEYWAFSYTFSQRQKIIQFIQNQDLFHEKMSFQQEIHSFLERFNIKSGSEKGYI